MTKLGEPWGGNEGGGEQRVIMSFCVVCVYGKDTGCGASTFVRNLLTISGRP